MSQLSQGSLSADAQEFFEYLTYSKNRNTAYNYARNVDAFFRFVRKPVRQVTPLDIEESLVVTVRRSSRQ